MNALIYFTLIFVSIYFGITWALSRIIGWFLLRKFNAKVRFGRISLPFSLKDVNICKSGFSVQIDEICIRSSFFNSEVTKLLSINIKDIRINKDINKKINLHKNDTEMSKPKVIDFRNKKVPPSIIKFAQFMAVHIHNISVVLMSNDFEPGWFLHATASELHLDGSIVHNAKTLLVTAALNDAQAKILRQSSAKQIPNTKSRPCLVELSFGISMDGVLIAQGPLSLEKCQLTMNNTKMIIHEGLYDFIRDAKKGYEIVPTPSSNSQPTSEKSSPTKEMNVINEFANLMDDDQDDVFKRILPILPKNFLIKIEDTFISAVRENSSNDFSSKLQLLMANGKFGPKVIDDEFKFPILHTGFQLQLLEIDTKHEKLLYVEQYTMETKLERDTLHIYSKLKTFQLIYNHIEVYTWLKNNFLTNNSPNDTKLNLIRNYEMNKKLLIASSSQKNRVSMLETFLKSIVVKGCAELWNVSTFFKLDDQNASICCSHTKFLLEQYNDIRSNWYGNKFVNLLLSNRHWSTELMVESLWWSLGSSGRDTNSLKKFHTRGNPFFLGVSLIKLCSYGNATKFDLSIHTLRTEYSTDLANFILQSVICLNQYKMLSPVNTTEPGADKSKNLAMTKNKFDFSGILLNAKITDLTFYFFNKFDACILLSLGEVSLARTQPITVIKLDTFQMAIQSSFSSSNFNLTDFTDIFANIKLVRLEIIKPNKTAPDTSQITVYIIDVNDAMWNSNLHMHIVTLVREINELKSKVMPQSDEMVLEAPVKPPSNTRVLFELYAENNTIFSIKISERHTMQIFCENAFITKKDSTRISVENIFINIDEHHIFTISNMDMISIRNLPKLTHEREHFKFQLESNKVWKTTIEGFKIIFPYAHNFSEAIQNEFVSLYKWLKAVHNYKKKEFTINSPLPSDLLIEVKEFLFEMSDDPFEVKLRDNYILLLDEYNESLKRQNIFDQKIKELCSDRLSFSTGTIKELYASLVKKNSEIYIQRSKKINEAGPTRTRLFAWIMTDVCIMAMADPTIHGTENVTRNIQMIDHETPWPEEGLEFVTLWCRGVDVSCSEWKFMLRDYPQPMFCVNRMHLFGTLCGAEQLAPRRAKRDVLIEIGHPFENYIVQRGMTTLKFYHDFDCELDKCSYAFGPCWEPVMAQCNLSFEKISSPSRDPSPPLPFWDKLRLLFHGSLTMIVNEFKVLLHASLDPYNTTEEMELKWNECEIFWTNARITFRGDFNVSVRTASRYDDCRMLHFPSLKLTFKLNWICLANPNDHHAVIPCAPDKLPEYSSNQVHDSFRAFRSQNVNIFITFETRTIQVPNVADIPSLDLYGSTLRWFESLKLILSGVTRPTRRGPVFNNIRPRKKQLSRHYKKAHLQMSLHKFQVSYWISHSRNRGFELLGNRVSFSSEHTLSLNPVNDGLIHRPLADWSTMYMNCELTDTEIWLKSNEKNDSSTENISDAEISFIAKYYFLSLGKVSYGRETLLPKGENGNREKATPTHKLVIYDLKGAWTKNNRDVAFSLFDSFMKAQKLKSNLSTEALKGFIKEGTTTPLKSIRSRSHDTPTPSTSSNTSQILSTTTTSSSQQTNHAASMLQQLIAEADQKPVVFSDDLSAQTREQQLQGLQACRDDDVTHYNWSISLVNSQVLLRGCETSGYVILSAAKAEILQRVHRPVWRDRSLVPKTTWVGSLECMQYYATVSGNQMETQIEEIMWLTVDNIQEKDKDSTVINELPDLPHLVGSGGSVGGVVSQTVGASGAAAPQAVELQRIVSRCKCEFFYVSYGDTTIDPSTLTEVPLPPAEDIVSPWEKQDDPVDAFTLMHHDLDVCTNSTQYAMILDIVNNLLLYVEPQRKQALEKLTRMKFQLQLYSSEDQKRPIQHLQTQIRSLMSKLRGLEKDIYLIDKARQEEGDTEELMSLYDDIKIQIRKCKETLNVESEELDMMLSCYKDTQLSQLNKLQTVRKDKPITIVRANEICFKHAQWRLTESDGQIGIADLILSNFLYTKKSRSDDSVEHLLELGYIRMNNLTQEIYKEVLCPTDIQKDMPIDHKRVLRVFCREKSPVGGISVKEHFEINVVPITIAITKKFYNTMLKFCFPDRLANEQGVDDIDETGSTTSLKSNKKVTKKEKKSSKDSEFYVKIEKDHEKDDVEKMKERAEKNKLFIYIKIPEVPVRVSYKGNKEKNIEDITDFSLVIPTLEYHNVTWTWLDLLLAMKSDSRRVILSQAIKQKLIKQIHRHKPLSSLGEKASPQEEDKAKMLFGNRHAVENKSQRRGIYKLSKP